MRKASNTIWRYCLSAVAFAAIINGGESISQTSNLPSEENPYTYPKDFEDWSEDFIPVYLYFTGGGGQNGATIDFNIESLPATTGEFYSWYTGAQSQGGNGNKGSDGNCDDILKVTDCHATGGKGGDGGNGGKVSVNLGSADSYDVSNRIKIQTSQVTESGGSYIVGAIASSIGGNGGKGGASSSISVDANGGKGGNGGNAESEAPPTTLTINKNVELRALSSGNESIPIGGLAQSAGGIGGDGGDCDSIVGCPNKDRGGGGGFAGDITINNDGIIELEITDQQCSNTEDGESCAGGAGLLAQSVGGQGGNASATGISLVTFGGAGGTGGGGGKINVTHTGLITTTGIGAIGINAQSVGGSGGSVPDSYSAVTLGSSEGGLGGEAQTVSVNLDAGIIRTDGNYAPGILSQSIGGGGGSVGSQTSLNTVGSDAGAGGDGGEATITLQNNGLIETGEHFKLNTETREGFFSPAVIVQSVGGGGGNAGSNQGIINVGSSGGDGGDGGNITAVLNQSTLGTWRGFSPGLVLQSIGGGGGHGGDVSSAGTSKVSVGGFGDGGAGGSAGDINATQNEINESTKIITRGIFSPGILVQGIGGGGGSGGSATSYTLSEDSSISVTVGGQGGDGGDAGAINFGTDVDESIELSVKTQRAFSPAISMMSVGGGGGQGGQSSSYGASLTVSSSVSAGGQGGDGGSGENVTAYLKGKTETSGFLSPGLSISSIGGGGGDGGSATSMNAGGIASASVGIGGNGGAGMNGGDVTLNFQGNSTTEGLFSPAIKIRSIGGGGGSGGSSTTAGASTTASISVGIGGSGEGGGDAGEIYLDFEGIANTNNAFSPVLLLQSIGGGGGDGGGATSGSMTISPYPSGTAVASIGGSAGEGGNGNNITLNLGGVIKSGNDAAVDPLKRSGFSPGVIIQTIGGGGGHGGVATSGSASISAEAAVTANVAIGGPAGAGGNAGTIEISSKKISAIETYGKFSPGLIAQAIGGGGGNGGSSMSLSGTIGGDGSASGGVSMGGSGGDGGTGGGIDLDGLQGGIHTRDEFSPGIILQSIGGGGGNGGTSLNYSLSAGGDGAIDATASIGGSGAEGGSGGDVGIKIGSRIQTEADHSPGLAVQSIGGGGGNGGSSHTVSATGSTKNTFTAGANLGGSAGDGNKGGDITIEYENEFAQTKSLVQTSGGFAPAIVVQSIGGGGGNGGNSSTLSASLSGKDALSANVNLGGNGGSGSDGGNVKLSIKGDLRTGWSEARRTTSSHAPGIIAQSIGGGGGHGGTATRGEITIAGEDSASVGIANFGNTVGGGSEPQGGEGGDGGSGSNVSIEVLERGSITTSGDYSPGVIAQSIGGGGGTGGSSKSGSISLTGETQIQLNSVIGGNGGWAGDGGNIVVLNTGKIRTGEQHLLRADGRFSPGLFAQSIGGGGGMGGSAYNGTITVAGESESGLGSIDGGVVVGGRGGAGGDAGSVEINSMGEEIRTQADFSSGIQAVSVGGGGGTGGSARSKSSNYGTSTNNLSVVLGGDGSGGGDASEVTITNRSIIKTGGRDQTRRGQHAFGIFGQSVGGGGGNGGSSSTDNTSIEIDESEEKKAYTIDVNLGGKAGKGGSGGNVRIYNTSPLISTTGHFAAAIYGQSIGGGGGAGGNSTSVNNVEVISETSVIGGVSLGGEGGTGGKGGDVWINSDKERKSFAPIQIKTLGAFAYGLFAQSVGGGGGSGGSTLVSNRTTSIDGDSIIAEGGGSIKLGGIGGEDWGVGGEGASGGDVSIDAQGLIATEGIGAIGLVAQSIGGGGGAGGSFTATSSQDEADEGEFEEEDEEIEEDLEEEGETKERNDAYINFILGGDGGEGHDGGEVSISNKDQKQLQINTKGINAPAIVAQSIGGGGGIGGSTTDNAEVVKASQYSIGGLGTVTGSGGNAGNGGVVNLGARRETLNLRLKTEKAASPSIIVQSIGGGGGAGGGTVTNSTGSAFSGSFDFGTKGGKAGSGSDVSTHATLDLTTLGYQSTALIIQSIGGGGGQGGNVSNTSTTSYEDNENKEEEKIEEDIKQEESKEGGNTNEKDKEDKEKKGYTMNFGVSKSGKGGSGGDAGDINVNIEGKILTVRTGSDGGLIQSIGGGGGSGGTTTTTPTTEGNEEGSISIPVAMNFGGRGGGGGNAGDINYRSNGRLFVQTEGNNSLGLGLQSIGGGGGRGGSVTTTNTNNSKSEYTFGASVSKGAKGGGGGRSGEVSLDLLGRRSKIQVATHGINSPGLVLQSIGGGGGIGSNSNAGNSAGNISVGFTMGGRGGRGGGSKRVDLNADLSVSTKSAHSEGVLIQSIGGGGGRGGSVAANVKAEGHESENKFSLGLTGALGGKGGLGGNGADATASINGLVTTQGHISSGITIQSIGGGGGKAGAIFNASNAKGSAKNMATGFSLGASGGGAGEAKAVRLVSKEDKKLGVFTYGHASPGVILQSIGGGGGNGSLVQNVSRSNSNEFSLGASVSKGGRGGSGGNSGAVAVDLQNLVIATEGANSSGLQAQTIGGGGGNAGSVNAKTGKGDYQISLALGANGGKGGSTGNASIEIEDAIITTQGASSNAIQIQAIGGGGGNASHVTNRGSKATIQGELGSQSGDGGNGGVVNVTSIADLRTAGNNSAGLFVQSIGGGGGSTNVTTTGDRDLLKSDDLKGFIAVGGQGGEGGDGGEINIDSTTNITTLGEQAHGLISQSLGGGGGRVALQAGPILAASDMLMHLGGTSGKGGNGDTAIVSNKGYVSVHGDSSYGLYVQSIGGGGGSVSSTSPIKVNLGGTGGDGGHGGDIEVVNQKKGIIESRGKNGIGVFAMSLGGGGGDVGTTQDLVTMGSKVGVGGNGGDIAILNRGTIRTTGEGGVGILARSLGGGGGRVASSINSGNLHLGSTSSKEAKGGEVTVINTGNIYSFGHDSTPLQLDGIGGGGGDARKNYGRLELGSKNGSGDQRSKRSELNNKGFLYSAQNFSPALIHQSLGGGGGSVINGKDHAQLGSQHGSGLQSTGKLILNNRGSAITEGTNSPGVFVQAIGGGGGRVTRMDGTAQLGSHHTKHLGDFSSGRIQLNNSAKTIRTAGHLSPTLVSQSIGGGGGWIGIAQGDLSLGAVNANGALSAGSIKIQNDAELRSKGDGSVGLMTQTIGGGGGYSAYAKGDLKLGSLTSMGNLSAGKIDLNNTGSILTLNDNSPIIISTNIGGGGGFIGGTNHLKTKGEGDIRLGSLNSEGNQSSRSNQIKNTGYLQSQGNYSPAILQQSIGGGGGSVVHGKGHAQLGSGSGSGDQSAGDLIWLNKGRIITSGDHSPAVFNQSIGGGGGRVSRVNGTAHLGNKETLRSSFLNSGELSIRNEGQLVATEGNLSPAIVSQTIGGGGGWLGISADDLKLGSSEALGDQSSGDLVLTNKGHLITRGVASGGILAQSIGGGGGYTAFANGSLQLGALNSHGVLSAGRVDLKNSSSIRTDGKNSPGIVATGVAGGGGFVAGQAGEIVNVVHLGGSGRTVSKADRLRIKLDRSSEVITKGHNSPGVLGQSIGGGGGYTSQRGRFVNMGQQGGIGHAGNVDIENEGRISTRGNHSHGVVAQSIGSGGGTAFLSDRRAVLGSTNGSNGNAGSVVVNNRRGIISTHGKHSIGVVAQSVGGGGGRLAEAKGDVHLGADGGSGHGGLVEIINERALISTTGNFSPAYLMQSVGGGGGHIAARRNGETEANTRLILGGGQQGAEGNGGPIQLKNFTGEINSSGKFSPGIVHQSIGGGGGWLGELSGISTSLGGRSLGRSSGANLNMRLPLAVNTLSATSPGVVIQSIGGGGGASGNIKRGAYLGGRPDSGSIVRGGTIGFVSKQPIKTFGLNSPGVLLQSIGGGGGYVGSARKRVELGGTIHRLADASAGNIETINRSLISTSNKRSPGFVAQSIGGGGGFILSGESAVLGSKNAKENRLTLNERAGNTKLINKGAIQTQGEHSMGVLIQSIANGGGIGSSNSGNVDLRSKSQSESGEITIENSGTIETSGTGSHGIVAQSISGSGGFVFGNSHKHQPIELERQITAESKDITLKNTGTILTRGDNAIAVLAQTAAGGAYIYQNPDGTTSRVTSALTHPSKKAGDVVVINSGSIIATGRGGIGITKSTNPVPIESNLRVVNTATGIIRGGEGGAAVQLPTRERESIDNQGIMIGGLLGQGIVIEGLGGNDEIVNSNLIAGNILLQGGRNTIANSANARLEATDIVLGRRAELVNAGTLSPDGAHRIGTMDLVAKYFQTKTGNYEFDLDVSDGQTDYFHIASVGLLEGDVTLVPTETGLAKPGRFTSTEFLTARDIPLDRLSFKYPKSAIADYELLDVSSDKGDGLQVEYKIDYSPQGLSPNSRRLGNAINRIQADGVDSIEQRVNAAYLYSIETTDELNEVYQQLSGEQNTNYSQPIIDSSLLFLKAAQDQIDQASNQISLACANKDVSEAPDQTNESQDSSVCQRFHAWKESSGTSDTYEGGGSSDQSGYETNSYNSSIGLSYQLNPRIMVGGFGQFSKLWTTSTGLSGHGTTELWNAAGFLNVALSKDTPNTLLSLMIGGGTASTDIKRTIDLPNTSTEKSSSDSTQVMGRIQLSHEFSTGDGPLSGLITPQLGISAIRYSQKNYQERTSSSSQSWAPGRHRFSESIEIEPSHSLRYSEATYTSIPLDFNIKFSQPFQIGTVRFNPQLSAGYSIDLSDTSRSLEAAFVNQPGHRFKVEGTDAPQSWWDFGLNLDVHISDSFALYANTRAELAAGTKSSFNYGGGFRWKF